MKKFIRPLLMAMVFSIFTLAIGPTVVRANSAEPPAVIILINNPPKDITLYIISNGKTTEAKVMRRAWEGYYAFYSRDLSNANEYILKVTTNGESFECNIPASLYKYNNVFTLDISHRTLTPGTYPLRSFLLIAIRVVLTLLIEGIIFWLFKYRQKRSWIIFLAVNLLTQAILNIMLNSESSLMNSYLILLLFFGEILVFLTEIILLPNLIREHRKLRIVLYVILSNFVSLIFGSYIIIALPV